MIESLKCKGALNFSPSQEMSRTPLEFRYCMDQTAPKVPLHSHSFYEFFIFAGGDLERYIIGQKNYYLVPGDILVIPPKVLHHPIFNRDDNQPYHRYYIWATRKFIDSMSKFPQGNYSIHCCAAQNEFLIHPSELQRLKILKLLNSAWHEMTTNQICSDLYLQAHCLRFFAQINNFVAGANGRLENISNQPNDVMAEVLTFIHDNYGSHLTLLSTAERFHVSLSTIENMFNKTIGKSFYNYVTEYRLNVAQAMILDGKSLLETSQACGYNDYSNFYRAFRRF